MWKILSILVAALLVVTEGCSNSTDVDKNASAKTMVENAMNWLKKAQNTIAECPKLKPMDCEDLLSSGCKKSGSYEIWPRSRIIEGESINVYCDMDTDGGGWTIIQRRGDFGQPKDYFYRNWTSYKFGFGDIEEDFWLGNDKIFALTNQKAYSVRFDLRSVYEEERYALYGTFWIEDETRHYTLHIEDYSGNAGDSMNYHNKMKFSTFDAKHDLDEHCHCAQIYKGAWWYNACHKANLNGLYLKGDHDSLADGVNWYHWRGFHESLEKTEIKIRSANFKAKTV